MTLHTAQRVQPSPRARILIVLTGSIGDVTRALCVPMAIKNALPEVEIGWLVEPVAAPLVQTCQAVNRTIVFDRRAGLRGFARACRDARAFHPDVTIDLQRILKSGVLSLASGARRRIGFAKANAKEFNWVFQTEFIPAVDERRVSKLEQYLEFCRALGVVVSNASLDFGLDALSLSPSIEGTIAACPKPWIGVILGSTWRSKDWPLSGYAEVLPILLRTHGGTALLCGGPKDKARALQLRDALPQYSERIVVLAGETSLTDLAALMKRCQVAFGPDSGPGHIAAAVGTPYVGLFGPTAPERTAPYRNIDRALQSSVGCSPCYRRNCPGLDGACMRLLTPTAIASKVQSALASIPLHRIPFL